MQTKRYRTPGSFGPKGKLDSVDRRGAFWKRSCLGLAFAAGLAISDRAVAVEEIAIWDFGATASTYTEEPSYWDAQTKPVISILDGQKDTDGKDGRAYTDLRSVAHGAGQAAAWTD